MGTARALNYQLYVLRCAIARPARNARCVAGVQSIARLANRSEDAGDVLALRTALGWAGFLAIWTGDLDWFLRGKICRPCLEPWDLALCQP